MKDITKQEIKRSIKCIFMIPFVIIDAAVNNLKEHAEIAQHNLDHPNNQRRHGDDK